MLKRCIMIFPKLENGQIIDKIREKYDPLANHVEPHITLVFPFNSDIGTKDPSLATFFTNTCICKGSKRYVRNM